MPLPEAERWIPEVFRSLSEQEKKGIVASYYGVGGMDAQVTTASDSAASDSPCSPARWSCTTSDGGA